MLMLVNQFYVFVIWHERIIFARQFMPLSCTFYEVSATIQKVVLIFFCKALLDVSAVSYCGQAVACVKF